MNEYILLMYNDAPDSALADDGERWARYFQMLRGSGCFDGGSAIGAGERLRRDAAPAPSGGVLGGYLRIRANDLGEAKKFLDGNPVYEAGGSVEILELPSD